MKRYRVAWTESHEEWIEAKDEDHAIEQAGQGDSSVTYKVAEGFEVLESENLPRQIEREIEESL